MKRMAVLAWLAWPALAHVISISSGELTISGTRAHYELRFPLYELAHMRGAEQALFDNLQFSSSGRAAELLDHACREDTAHGVYACAADYEFPSPPESIEVHCGFYRVTVPNHVHLLRANRDGKHDQAILDAAFSRALLRFRAPGSFEIAVQQAAAGFERAWGGFLQIVFLAALVLAARNRRELAVLAIVFISTQSVAALLLPLTQWQPPLRFAEAAAALTIAYLAVEILMLPEAGARWAVVALLGAFHGMYFEMLLRATGLKAANVLCGAAMAQFLLIAIFALLFGVARRRLAAWKPVPISAGLLLAIGMAWFVMRIRG